MLLAKGLYFIFWGLLVAVLTTAQLVISADTQRFAEFAFGGGLAGIVAGTWRLRQARLNDAGMSAVAWQARARTALWCAGLTGYFGAFFLLWQRLPENSYLLANAAGFVGAGIAFLIALSRAISAMASATGERDLVVESKLFSAGNVALLLVPFVCVAVFVLRMVVTYEADPLQVLRFLAVKAGVWVTTVMLLPFALTASLVWVAKDAVVRRLMRIGSPD